MDLKSKNFMDDNENFNKSIYWVLSELKEESFVLENKDQEIEFCFREWGQAPFIYKMCVVIHMEQAQIDVVTNILFTSLSQNFSTPARSFCLLPKHSSACHIDTYAKQLAY